MNLAEGVSVGIVEMLFSTNIMAVVGTQDRAVFVPRRLTIWDTNIQTSRMDIAFDNQIVYVKLNKKRQGLSCDYVGWSLRRRTRWRCTTSRTCISSSR